MLLRKIDQTSSVSRKPGSGRPQSVRSELNIQLVTDLICSQEGAPGTGKSPREIEKETVISRSSVRRIAQRDLQLRVFKRKKAHLLSDADRKTCLEHCRVLLRRRALQQVHKIWFSDKKIFTVQPPINTQNDRLYDTAEKKLVVPSTWLLKGCKHFSEHVMVSVAVSKSGKTDVHFVDKGTKVCGAYYRDILLKNCLLPDIRRQTTCTSSSRMGRRRIVLS